MPEKICHYFPPNSLACLSPLIYRTPPPLHKLRGWAKSVASRYIPTLQKLIALPILPAVLARIYFQPTQKQLSVFKFVDVILVTGGAGYVGSHFVRAFLAENQEEQVVVIDNLSKGHQQALPQSDRLSLVVCDIGDREKIGAAITKYAADLVVHFAAKADVAESQRDPFGFLHNNITQSLALFESMEKHNLRKVVFSSSCAVYGEPRYLPLDEKHEQNPANVYGVTKMAIEHILRSFTDSLGWSSISLRYFNAAGADEDGQCGESHDPETHLIPNLLKAAMGKLEVATIHGNDYQTKDGTCIRDYVHVNDLARAHCLAVELLRRRQTPSAFAVNLGSTQGWTVSEVLATCEKVTQRQIPRRYAPRRSGDPPALVANAELAEQLLGWKPRYDLKEIVETAWRWEEKRLY